MSPELQEQLYKDFPKIFREKDLSSENTCMCWGICTGDGWYSILRCLCLNIQSYVDNSRKHRASALRFNRALARAARINDIEPLVKFYTRPSNYVVNRWAIEAAETDLLNMLERAVPEACPQVVAVQVKEKFGTLRFYIDGGNEYTSALVQMAESFSGVTCEVCGDRGELVGGGWLQTLCKTHAEEKIKRNNDDE